MSANLGQLILCLAGVAVGVAGVLAMDIAIESSHRAFRLSVEGILGPASHRVVGGPRGVPEDVYRRLRVDVGLREIAPVLATDVELRTKGVWSWFRLVGIDPWADESGRSWGEPPGSGWGGGNLLTDPAAVLLERETAARLGFGVGDEFRLRVGGVEQSVRLADCIDTTSPLDRRRLDRSVVADIATVQELTGRLGWLSWIDVKLSRGEPPPPSLEHALPPECEVTPVESPAEMLDQMTHSFQFNLRCLSLLSLIVGLFLIYNAMTFSVLRRRDLFGRLRALGVRRGEILALVLGEAACLGALGTGIGLVGGIVLGWGLIDVVTDTIEDLYFVVSVREYSITATSFVRAAVLGIGTALWGSILPAREASAARPRLAVQRSVLEESRRASARRRGGLALFVLVSGGTVLWLPAESLYLGYAAMLFLLVGFVLLAPYTTVLLARLFAWPCRIGFGARGKIAALNLERQLSRTAAAIIALAVAVAMTVGVRVTIHSFRQCVIDWLDHSLAADLYVTTPGPVPRRASQTPLAPQLVELLLATEGVRAANTTRSCLVSGANGVTRLSVLEASNPKSIGLQLSSRSPSDTWNLLDGQEVVVVSEPYAYRHRLHPGDEIRLRTDHGERMFRVAGLFRDYTSEEGYAVMSRRTYQRHWSDRAVTSLAIFVDPAVDVSAVRSRLEATAGPVSGLRIRSHRDLRASTLAVFDRTFAVTAVLRALATAVAVVGIFSTLVALALERRRELGILRAIGFTPGDVGTIVGVQSALMGLAAGILAIPLGTAFAALLTLIINRRSFGWSLDLHLTPQSLIEGVVLGLVSSLCAAAYPGWRVARMRISEALRAE